MENGEIISRYLEFLKDVKHLKPKTLKTEKHLLVTFDRKLKNKDFKDAIEQDILDYLKPYSTMTQDVRLRSLRKFYRWLLDLNKNELPKCLKRIETKYKNPLEPYRQNIKYKERIVSVEEYNVLIDNCYKVMHKAMIETLYLFGCRAGELLSMNSQDVTYDGEFTRVVFRDSKELPRENVYYGRAEHLLKWVETYQPFKKEKDKPLWVTPIFTHRVTKETSRNTRFTINGLEKMVKVISKRAGIRRITPHDFRHTFVSRERKQGTPQTFIEKNAGFRAGTMMMEIYDHNKTKDYEDYLKRRQKVTPVTYELLKKQKGTLEEEQGKEIGDLQKEISDLKNQLKKKTEIDSFIMDSLGVIAKEMIQKEGVESIKEIFRKHNVPLAGD